MSLYMGLQTPADASRIICFKDRKLCCTKQIGRPCQIIGGGQSGHFT